MENGLKHWLEENNRLTRQECHKLLRDLKEQHLDPILRQLSGKDGASVTFAQIIGGYSAIEQGFKTHSRGAKDVCAQMFYEFHPVRLYVQIPCLGELKEIRFFFQIELLDTVNEYQ